LQMAGEQGPLWIVARRQSAGYGRRAREWRHDVGDFAGTLLFRPAAQPALFGQISFITALAVAETIAALVRDDSVTVKWPNDVLIHGGKAAGVLLEHIGPKDKPLLAVGIGINVISKPGNLDYPAARLMDHMGTPAPLAAALAASIDARFWTLIDLWMRDGFAPIRTAWLAKAAGLGKAITVRMPNEEISGIFDDIDETGGLVLRFNGATRIISAGEIFFGPTDGKQKRD